MELTPSEPERSIGQRDLTHWHTRAGQALSRWFQALAERLRNPEAAALLTLLAAGGLAIGATMVAGEIYEAVVDSSGVAQLDQPLLSWMMANRNPGLNAAIAVFSASGGPIYMSVITLGVVLALCWRWHRWTPLVLMLITVGGSLAMTIAGKRLIGRARPPIEESIPPPETSASFPSGHALNSIVIAGMLAYLLISHLTSKLARAAAVTIGALYALSMGLSRVYLGHHWLTDVLAAWCLGVAWLTVVITCHRLWLTTHQDHVLGRRPAIDN